MRPAAKVWYLPWCNLAAMFLMMTTAVGFGINGMTLFYDAVVTELSCNGFTQTNFSLYYSLANLSAIFSFPFFGVYYTKRIHRMKQMLFAISLITFSTYIGYSFSYRLWHFYALSIIRGIVSSGLATIPVTTVLNNWFVEKRNTVISVALMGSSFGTIFYTKISEYFIVTHGWRIAYFAAGLIEFLTLCLVVMTFSPTPSFCHAQPYGALPKKVEIKSGISVQHAIHMPMFWATGFSFFLGAVALMGIQQCFTTALQVEHGLSISVAGNAMGIHMLAICGGKYIMGVLYDHFDHRVGLLYSSALAIFGILLLTKQTIGPAQAYLFALCFGLGNMSSSITSATLTSDLFGLSEYAAIYGFFNMFIYGGVALAPLAASAIYDKMGSYRSAWYLFVGVMALSCSLLFATLTKRRSKLYIRE